MTKFIPLTKGLTTTVDDSAFETLSKWHWHTQHAASCIYAARDYREGGKRIRVYMHRQIADCPPRREVHHKNGDTLDNRKENLEVVEPQKHGKFFRKEPTNAKDNRNTK